MKVLLSWAAEPDEIERVRSHLPLDAEVVAPPRDPYLSRYESSPAALLAEIPDAEVLMGWVAPREVIEQAPKLRIIIWLHAGCDQLDLDLLREREVQLANVSGANAGVVAEQAFLLMLGLAKNALENHRAVVEGAWRPWWDPSSSGVQLGGRVLGIVGLGRVGGEVAKRARAFDMRVIAVKRNPAVRADAVDVAYPPEDLRVVLGKSDFVVLSVPLTPLTRHLLGEAELRAMKPTAFLINVARGHIVAEPAVHRALSEGWIAGFASDVWWDYSDAMPPSIHFPVPSRTGVHKLPKVFASGDASANILAVKDAMLGQGIENLAAFARGEPLPRPVDLNLGY